MKSNIIELKNQHLSFRPNETKLFAFSIVENKLPVGDVVISGKSISCKTKYGISLTYVYGKHENKFQVKPSPGGTSAKVENNKSNYIFRNKNIDRIDYEELVLKNNNDDLQVGVFSLFQPKAHVHKTDDAESASIDPATLSSRAFKSLSIKKPESGLMVSKKNDAPILIGEWHPVHFTLSILEDTLPEDIPSNIVTHMSLNANDNDAVNLNIKTKCFLVVKNDADKDNGQKIFKLLDKNHSNHGRDDSIDNKNGTGEIENDECNFSVSIGSKKSNLYELIVYVCITTVDGNNFYSNINVDSVLHLTLNIEHTSTRCINVLSTVRKYVLKLENPINMDMSIIALNPELLPPLIHNDKLKLLGESKSNSSKSPKEGIFRLIKSQRAILHFNFKCASDHALKIYRIEYIPNEYAKHVSPNESNLDYSDRKKYSGALELRAQDVKSNCFGIQPIKDGLSMPLGQISITWSRLTSLPNPLEVDEDGVTNENEEKKQPQRYKSSFILPNALVYPLQGIGVDIKTNTDIASYCKPFEMKVYLINNTVSSEQISLELTSNENFLCAGRTSAVLNIQPMSTIVVTYILTGIEVGLLLLPQIEVKSLKLGKYLIDYGKNNRSKRFLYVKPE